jgi:ABC-2 type transport system permease protein
MFFIVFTGLDAAGQLNRFPLGVVSDEAYRSDTAFQAAIESVSGEDGLFELSIFASKAEANKALENGDITGYIHAGEIPQLFVSGDGIEQTIAKGFLDRFIQTSSGVEFIVAENPEAIAGLPALLTPINFTVEISLSHNPPTKTISYFYALLAMVCMYGCFQGHITMTYLQANLSSLGMRRTLSPVARWKMVVYDLLSAFTVHIICMFITVMYITLVLKTSFGPQIWAVLLTCVAGSLLGIAFGAMVSAMSRMKEVVKVTILVTVTMVCSFLAGLMIGDMNYIVAQKAPVVSWLNPAARISDAFYCLYYYDNYQQYFINIGIIMGLTIIMFLVTAIFLRRQRYESV